MRSLRRARSRAGTASVEIVVMLPVMIILFVAVYHFYSLGRAELGTSQAARGCVWEYAMSGCESEGPLCAGVSVNGRDRTEDMSPNQGKEPEPVDTRYQRAKDSSSSVMEKAENIPIVKQIVQLIFGTVASASASTKVQKLRSEEESRVVNDLYLVCNTVSESWKDKIADALCDVAKAVVGKGVPGC